MQLRYFMLEFEMLLRWCLLNCSNCYSFFLAASKKMTVDLSEAKKINVVVSCIHSIRLFAMEVNSEDFRRCVCSFAGGISHQQAAVSEAKIFLSGHRDIEFKGNFCISRATFAYLVSELKPTLVRHDFLCSPIPAHQHIAITLWRLGTKVGYRTISYTFVLDSPSCPSITSRNTKSGFTNEWGYKTTSETGLQPGFKYTLYSLFERNNLH